MLYLKTVNGEWILTHNGHEINLGTSGEEAWKRVSQILNDKCWVDWDNICAVCGAELPTESGRIICKKCENKDL